MSVEIGTSNVFVFITIIDYYTIYFIIQVVVLV
jgi:hypothetical protein